MNKELKTLKDLEGYELSDYGIFEDAVLISELRKEAIKWIKNICWCIELNEQEDRDCPCWDWKKFFNITEEDLK